MPSQLCACPWLTREPEYGQRMVAFLIDGLRYVRDRHGQISLLKLCQGSFHPQGVATMVLCTSDSQIPIESFV